jgi:hypothetical protein
VDSAKGAEVRMKRVFFLIAFYLIAGGMTLASAQGFPNRAII